MEFTLRLYRGTLLLLLLLLQGGLIRLSLHQISLRKTSGEN